MTQFEYSFGLEEEFFLSHIDTGMLAVHAGTSLLQKVRDELGSCVTSEMLQSQIEISSPIFRHVGEALTTMTSFRNTLADTAASLGFKLVAAGTHPLGFWQEQRVVDEPRYEQLLTDFRIVGRRNLVCGLHVHVGIPSQVDRVDVMNRVMRWLPLFLALSTSSPFWNGRSTGLLSYRQALYDEWPRSGVPDFFESEADYSAFINRMSCAGAIRDSRQVWWAIRPAARFPTLELRIADACTFIEDSIAIASLFRCLIAAAIEHPELGGRRTTHTRRIIDENRWRAKRDGLNARFIAEASSETLPVVQVLDHALELVATQAERLECTQALRELRNIFARGTSAHLQLQVYDDCRAAGTSHEESMRQVLSWLEAATLQHTPTSLGDISCAQLLT